MIEVGDMVQIKAWEEMRREYSQPPYDSNRIVLPGVYGFVPQMEHLCGHRAIVIGKTIDHLVLAGLDTDWMITEYMVRTVGR